MNIMNLIHRAPDGAPITPSCGHVDCHLVKHPRIAAGVAIRECRIDAAGEVIR